jgi:hypothetical protein
MGFLNRTFGGYNTVENVYSEYDVLTHRHKTETHQLRWDPDWCSKWYWFPIFWVEDNRILWPAFLGQTAFIAVLAVIIVNIRSRRTKGQQSQLPTQTRLEVHK